MKKSIMATILGAAAFAANAAAPAVKVTQEEGFVDFAFPVQKVEQLQDGTRSVAVHGSLGGQPVGFAVEFHPNWKRKQIEGSQASVYWGTGRFMSTGGDTDRFIDALARLYGVAGGLHQAKASVDAEVVGLDADPAAMASAPTRMKFFFQGDGSQGQYSEVFINADLKRGILYFNEKDVDYRAPLVRNLAK
ncbi:hypothetical protein [Duganella sp. Root1480D1]|uniref:hypothetical protein n=1 Tax=Duganella sp. Root1480D1 TaxID=1736471 RepID=UPI00070FEBF6|nr:hypothetical protein [Duganella sp. Root1480D1]KQZ32595.1 hypothetical protein ASD58_08190 [Duganella sp. Root1480D1]